MLDRLFDWLFAPGCVACDGEVPPRSAFCAPCAASVVRASPSSSAAFAYGGALQEAIQRAKYGDRSDVLARLGDLLAAHAAASPLSCRATPPYVVVPVPLHPRKLVERGFNAAALLARPVARALGAPLDLRTLVRLEERRAQARLGRGDRAANVRGVFAVRRRATCARILLVDDVITTGATFADAERALREGGAAVVERLALAAAEDIEFRPPLRTGYDSSRRAPGDGSRRNRVEMGRPERS